MSNIIKIVGIDSALRNMGLALGHYNLDTRTVDIVQVKLLQTQAEKKSAKVVRKSSDDMRCGREMYLGLHAYLKEAGATIACGEVPTGAQSARAAFSFGMTTMLLATVPFMVQVNPTEVKLAAVGHKHAAKEEMIEWAVAAYPEAGWLTDRYKGAVRLLSSNEHLADAAAAVKACVLTDQFQQAVAMMGVARAA